MNNDQQSSKPSQTVQFIDGLIDEKFADHKSAISPEIRSEIKDDLMLRLDNFIGSRIIAVLSDEDIAQFEKLLREGKTKQEVQQFASTHINNFTDFITQAFLEFRTIYLGKH